MTYRGHRVSRTLIKAYISPLVSTGGKYVYSGSAVSGQRMGGFEWRHRVRAGRKSCGVGCLGREPQGLDSNYVCARARCLLASLRATARRSKLGLNPGPL